MPILLLVFFIYFKINDKISKENSSDKPKANKKNILKGNKEEIISQKSSDEKNIVKEIINNISNINLKEELSQNKFSIVDKTNNKETENKINQNKPLIRLLR